MDYVNSTFTETDVLLDGSSFEQCTFDRCRLIYAGGDRPVMIRNSINSCDIVFTEAAERTLQVMAAFYHGGLKDVIEGTVENIRGGSATYLPRILTGRIVDSTKQDPGMIGQLADDTPADLTESVFPIFQMRGPGSWLLLGTGFFITDLGAFVTAKHVVVDEHGQPLPSLHIVQMIRRQSHLMVRQVVQLSLHPTADIAVGLLAEDPGRRNRHLVLTDTAAEIGESIYTLAFPRPKVMADEITDFTVRYYPKVRRGKIVSHFPSGRDRFMLPGNCYETTLDLRGHSSGGPVFGKQGTVIGVNSTGLDEGLDTTGLPPVSYISSIDDCYSLSLRDVQKTADGDRRVDMTVAEMRQLGLVWTGSKASYSGYTR